ncbi:MAG TPA: nucleotidyl transferase AbiEii/AbiGii toxin family protein [Pyrinomonadaceae bacterium]|nr:nucleotidyl transferase AbiEii/AbiGii toxin family protein [Pyrinomonadaceae bacterium]
MSESNLPEWEQLLSAAAHLQEILPGATLVGGTAVAIFAQHRLSRDADHVLPDLRNRFDEVLGELEAVAGWRTARVKRPVLILGSLDGIETGVQQMIREQPLETQEISVSGVQLVVPTEEELLRIKGVLILKRNATRDYVDFAALSERIGPSRVQEALAQLDQLYPQPNGESALQQLQVQLANPMPYDLENTDLTEYRKLDPKWHDWNRVKEICGNIAVELFKRL